MASSAAKLLFQGSAVASRQFEGRFFERIKKGMTLMYEDYKFVLQQMGTDAKARPVTAFAKLAAFVGSVVLYNTNTNMSDFHGAAIECANTIALLGYQERNERVCDHVHRMTSMCGTNHIRRLNLFICSLYFEDTFNSEVCRLPLFLPSGEILFCSSLESVWLCAVS
jgi:hypothetical protein